MEKLSYRKTINSLQRGLSDLVISHVYKGEEFDLDALRQEILEQFPHLAAHMDPQMNIDNEILHAIAYDYRYVPRGNFVDEDGEEDYAIKPFDEKEIKTIQEMIELIACTSKMDYYAKFPPGEKFKRLRKRRRLTVIGFLRRCGVEIFE